MEELSAHYRVLGIDERSSAQEIQKAFRAQIKQAHPDVNNRGGDDRARILIEAYKAIRHAPLEKIQKIRPARSRPASDRNAAPQTGTTVVHEEKLGRFFDRLSDIIYADDNEWAMYGAHDDIQEFLYFRKKRQVKSEEKKRANEYFSRAEELLKLIVARYNRMKNKKARSWSQNYIANLVEIKVLYRDVLNRYPDMTEQATLRLSQIEDLIMEIRKIRLS